MVAVNDSDLPEGLGRGFYSVGERGAQDAVIRSHGEKAPIGNVDAYFHVITSERTRTESFSLSAQASFRAFGGRGSVAASFSRRLSLSSTSVTAVLRKTFFTDRFRLIKPRLTKESREFWKANGHKAFLRTYGDYFINEVIEGAALYIAMSTTFDSVEKAEEARIELSGKVGAYSGSAQAASSMFEKIVKQEIVLSATTVGYPDVPEVSATETDDKKRMKKLFRFYDKFEENVKALPKRSEVSFDKMPFDQASGHDPKGMPNFDLQLEAIEDALALKTDVRLRTDVFKQAQQNPAQFDQITAEQCATALTQLTDADETLERFADRLFKRPADASKKLPVRRNQLPNVPRPSQWPTIASVMRVRVGPNQNDVAYVGPDQEHMSKLGLHDFCLDYSTGGTDLRLMLKVRRIVMTPSEDITLVRPANTPIEANMVRFIPIAIWAEGLAAPNYTVGMRLKWKKNGEAPETPLRDTGWLMDGTEAAEPIEGGLYGMSYRVWKRI